MTIHEAKKDAARRLANAGIAFTRLTGKTVSFGGFGYDDAVFVTIRGALLKAGWKTAFTTLPKPSAGGYCVMLDVESCLIDGKPPMFT